MRTAVRYLQCGGMRSAVSRPPASHRALTDKFLDSVMIRARFFWAVIFSAAFFPDAACFAIGFCDEVTAVVAASARLSDLAGKEKRSRFWEATKTVSGFRSCEIMQLAGNSLIFTCEMSKRTSLELAKQDFKRVQRDIVACFPAPPWEHDTWTSSVSSNKHSFRLRSDGSSGLVSIDDSFADTPQMSQEWLVSLTIYDRAK